MPHTIKRPALILSLVLTVGLLLVPANPAGAASRCNDDTLVPSSSNVAKIRSATRCLLDKERERRGLRALTANSQLRKAASKYSRQMVRDGFFDHVSPGGSTLLSRVKRSTSYLRNARGYSLGENLAWGSYDLATPRQTVRSWMRSSGHRRNILNRRFRNIGIGIASGAPESISGPAATYTTVFGTRSKRSTRRSTRSTRR